MSAITASVISVCCAIAGIVVTLAGRLDVTPLWVIATILALRDARRP